MVTDPVRYVDRTTSGALSVEVSFNGSPEGFRGDAPTDTDVRIRVLRKSSLYTDSFSWIELFVISLGNPTMPSGAWNGIKLTELIGDRVFVAISTELFEIDADTGSKLWSIETGNTPIYSIMASKSADALIVFNGYYGFAHKNGLGNICSVSLEGEEEWRTPLPSEDDIFANAPEFDGDLLKSSSWCCLACTIDQATGEIVHRRVMK